MRKEGSKSPLITYLTTSEAYTLAYRDPSLFREREIERGRER